MDWRALRFSALDGRGDCACHRFGAMPWKRFAKERFLPIRGGLPWLVYIGVFPDCGAMLRVGKGHPPFSQGVLPGKAQRNSLGKCAERGGVCCVQTCFRFARRWNITEKLFFISTRANALPVLESINWWTVGAFCVRRCNGETLLVVSAPNALLNAARRHGRSRGLPWSRLRIDIGDASESPR